MAIVFWMPPRPLPVHLALLNRGCLGPGIFSAWAVAEGTVRTSRNEVLGHPSGWNTAQIFICHSWLSYLECLPFSAVFKVHITKQVSWCSSPCFASEKHIEGQISFLLIGVIWISNRKSFKID